MDADLLDKQILRLLYHDARADYSALSRKLGVGVERIKYRITPRL